MQKYTRKRLYAFLERHATDTKILHIGGGGTPRRNWFPNEVILDINPEYKPDILGDAAHIPVPDSSFEAVLCCELLEHVSNPEEVASEIHRVLKPNGLLLLTTPFIFPVHMGPSDYFRYTPEGLRSLFNGFSIESIEAGSGPFETIATLFQRIIFQTDVRGGKFTKGILMVLASLFSKLDFLITRQWDGIDRKHTVDIFMTSGLYMVARKK